ncbi:YlxQ family RNA-binding protein [Paenibacillus albiflavus]|uniref:YlxQ family RNA-binding protein n=1 Tax=Paenibacillus albiflavus TaxID=2545760 RepID=A0A4R4EKK9_9BACL|nr:YlxQ family RNA-binding protein [Paenibacillus albiflavus]TCZ80003.1 YlxQ family RNA-binding protein [Paenibacillus albiflavus]
MSDKFYSGLGLATRARKLVTGEETVLKAIRSGEAKLVILAEDASEGTHKKFHDKCTFYNVPIIVYGTRESLGASIGKEARVSIAIVDEGFVKMLRKSLL